MAFDEFLKASSLNNSERAGLAPIYITFKKTAPQIAADISRRLLPEYEKTYVLMVQRLADVTSEYGKAVNAAVTVNGLLQGCGLSIRQEGMHDPKATPTLSASNSNGGVSLYSIRFYQNSTCWDRISFNMALSLRLFSEIARFLRKEPTYEELAAELRQLKAKGASQ